ncbi:MAG: NFACT RNA binding domain-containing protein [Candidatus Woesearchaeota archaeon]|nr:NFACT RNA binding domain-containing protein [Candidatus Woesearchaeota archaeon]
MQLILNIKKSLEQNAGHYFEKAKKARKKIKGAEEAIAIAKAKLEKLKKEAEKEEKEKTVIERKKEWYEKFRWFVSSEDFLCIGGRDATTNDIIVKKHLDKDDLVFHTEMPGSPFVIVKADGREIGEKTKKEAAQFTAANSRAWNTNLVSVEAYCVNSDQVSLETPSGEYMGKGSFMIYGKKNFVSSLLKISIGIMKEGRIMAAPEEAVKKHCIAYVNIKQGSVKKSDCAKKVKKILEDKSKIRINLDDVMAAMPPGDCEVKQ